MNVLVTDLRYRMSLAAIRDLSERGHAVYGLHFGPPAPPPAAALCAGLRGWRSAPDLDGPPRARAALDEAERLDAVILPVGARTLAALAESGETARCLTPAPEQLRFANDKARVLALARTLGIETPEQWDGPERASLPAVVKYRDGERLGLHAAQRYAVVRTPEELDAAWTRMAARAAAGGQEPPLLQSYVAGGGLGVSCLFDRAGRPVAAICHRRLREYPLSGGPSAACEAIWDDGLVRRALTLLRAMDWRGVAMAEFKGTAARPTLMEINPRVWGSYPLTRVSGSGFSEKWARAAAGETLPELDGPAYRVGARMGFRLSNLAASAACLRAGRFGESLRAARDAFRLPDGVLEKSDRAASNAYLREALRRRGR